MVKAVNVPPTQPLYEHAPNQWRPWEPPAANGLYDLVNSPLVYEGGFLINPNGAGADPNGLVYTGGQHRVGAGRTANAMFMGGRNLGTSGSPFIAEASIPALVGGNDVYAFNQGAVLQGYRNLNSDFTTIPEFTLSGVSYIAETGALFCGGFTYYDNNNQQNNLMHYVDAADLAASAKVGMYAIGGGAHAGGFLIDLPAQWRTAFGCTHLSSGGVGMAIVSRASNGPSAWRFNTQDPTNFTATPLLDYPLANFLGTNMDTDPIWSHITKVAGGMVIPGTSTLMFVGHTLDNRGAFSDNYVKYGSQNGTNDIGEWIQGYYPYRHQGIANCAWLYDLNDLLATYNDPVANPPHAVQPYQFVFLPEFPVTAWNKRITGFAWHPLRQQAIVSIQGGASPRYGNATPSFAAFRFE